MKGMRPVIGHVVDGEHWKEADCRRDGDKGKEPNKHHHRRRLERQCVVGGNMECLGKLTLWPPTFQLVGANQHGIKPLGTLMAQKVTIGMEYFSHLVGKGVRCFPRKG